MPSPTNEITTSERNVFTDELGREHTIETTYITGSDGKLVPILEREHIMESNGRFSSIDIEHVIGEDSIVLDEHIVRSSESGEYNETTRHYSDHGELTDQSVVSIGQDGIAHTTDTRFETNQFGLPISTFEKETYTDKDGYKHEISRAFDTASFGNSVISEEEIITDKDGNIIDKDQLAASRIESDAPSDVASPASETVDTRERVMEHIQYRDEAGQEHDVDRTYAVNEDGSRDKVSEVDRVDNPTDSRYSSETVERQFNDNGTAVEVKTTREEPSGSTHEYTEKYSSTGVLVEDHRIDRNPDGTSEERIRTFEANSYDVPMTSHETDISIDKNGYRVETNREFDTNDYTNKEISVYEIITDRDGNVVDRDQMMADRIDSEPASDAVSSETDNSDTDDRQTVTIPDSYTDRLGREHTIERVYAVDTDDKHVLVSEKDHYDSPRDNGAHVETERKYYDNGQIQEERITRVENSGITHENIKHYSETGSLLDEKISRVNPDGSRHEYEQTFTINAYNLPKTVFDKESDIDRNGFRHVVEHNVDPYSFNSKPISTNEYYQDKDGNMVDKDGNLIDKSSDVEKHTDIEGSRDVEDKWYDADGHLHTVEVAAVDSDSNIAVEKEAWINDEDGVKSEHEITRTADGDGTLVEEKKIDRYEDGTVIETTTKYTESPDGDVNMISETAVDITDAGNPVEIEEKTYENGELVSIEQYDSDGNMVDGYQDSMDDNPCLDDSVDTDNDKDHIDSESDDNGDWDPVD